VTIAKRPSLGTGPDRNIPVLFFCQEVFLKFRNWPENLDGHDGWQAGLETAARR
jgi:hypothetical protein